MKESNKGSRESVNIWEKSLNVLFPPDVQYSKVSEYAFRDIHHVSKLNFPLNLEVNHVANELDVNSQCHSILQRQDFTGENYTNTSM